MTAPVSWFNGLVSKLLLQTALLVTGTSSAFHTWHTEHPTIIS